MWKCLATFFPLELVVLQQQKLESLSLCMLNKNNLNLLRTMALRLVLHLGLKLVKFTHKKSQIFRGLSNTGRPFGLSISTIGVFAIISLGPQNFIQKKFKLVNMNFLYSETINQRKTNTWKVLVVYISLPVPAKREDG